MQKLMFREVRWLVQGHTNTDAIEQTELEIRSCFLIKNSSQCSKKQNIKRKNSFPNVLNINIQSHFFPSAIPLQSQIYCSPVHSIQSVLLGWKSIHSLNNHYTTTMDLTLVSQIQFLLKETYIWKASSYNILSVKLCRMKENIKCLWFYIIINPNPVFKVIEVFLKAVPQSWFLKNV